MPSWIARLIITFTIALAVVAPKSVAVLASVGVLSSQRIVICTGEGLITITLGPDGAPIEVEEEREHCALTAFDPVWPQPPVLSAPLEVVVILRPAASADQHTHRARYSSQFARAPPKASDFRT